MASNSPRRYASSDDSKKRRSIYISGRRQDRALGQLRDDTVRGPDTERSDEGRRASSRRGGTARRHPGKAPSETSRSASAAAKAAESRRAERERRRAAQTRTTRLRTAAVAVAIAIVLGGCWALYRSPVFAVTRVEVSGTVNLSVERVRALAKVPADATLVRFPADAVAERVARDPWVESVTVSRVFPNGMRIRVVERTPVVMVDAGASFWLVDRTGMVIARRSAEQTATYVAVRDVPGLDPKAGRHTTSEPLLNVVRVLDGLSPAIVSQVSAVSAPTVDGTTLYTRDRVEIVVGEAAELAKKSGLIETILREQQGKVVSIDVRTTDRPTWRGLQK